MSRSLLGQRRSRPLCYVHRGGNQELTVVETCTRTIHGLPLLRPSRESNEIVIGALGRAAEYYDVPIYAFGSVGNHYHCLYGVRNALQMSRFQCHLNSKIARELGRQTGQRERFWSRRYRPVNISHEKAAQLRRLEYILAHGTKEGLVERPLDWPGPNAARSLVHGEPMVGYWFNRTKEYNARRKGRQVEAYDFATRYEVHLQQLPAYADLSPEDYRQVVAELLCKIETEAAGKRGGRPVLGVDRVLAQDPRQPVGRPKKSPAPALFTADSPAVFGDMKNRYNDFVDQYDIASGRMLEAALQGYRLDPCRYFPDGSFPSSVIAEVLRHAAGFNPAAEFPGGSFPRPWPFVGGALPPPPPDPPSRLLVYQEVDGKLAIVDRGAIPTVRVAAPCRSLARERPLPETPPES